MFTSGTIVSAPEVKSEIVRCARLYSKIRFTDGIKAQALRKQFKEHLKSLRSIFGNLTSPDFILKIGAENWRFLDEENVILTRIGTAADSVPKSQLKSYSGTSSELVILTHEVGHAVFEKNFGIGSLKLEKLNSDLDSALKKMKKVEKALIRLNRDRGRSNSLKTNSKEAALRGQLELERSRLSELREKEQIVLAYHELFADLSALVSSQSPVALTQAVEAVYAPIRNEDLNAKIDLLINLRDYSRRPALNDVAAAWTRLPDLTNPIGEPHGVFLPIKFRIWNAIARDSEDHATRGLVLQKVLDAMREQARELFVNSRKQIKESSLAEINDDLLRRIEKKFAR